jgi:1-acyl-sn-glycerol-3-phosphate acyltransferase
MTNRAEIAIPLFDPRAYERLLRAVSFFRQWFEPTIEGLEHIPVREGGLIVTNHGHFGIDLPVLLSLVLEGTGRPIRSLGDRLVFAAPFFRDWAHMMGAIEGEPEAALELLRDDQLVLVYPGGAREALHDPEEAYRLDWDKSRGFIRTALRAQKPIIPIAGIGNEELYVQVVSQDRVRESGVGRFISRFLGDKYVFPLYMGLGPLPFPADLHFIVAEPIYLPYGPEAADDEAIVDELHRKVTETTQALLDEGLRAREERNTSAGTGADTDTVAGADTDTVAGADTDAVLDEDPDLVDVVVSSRR